METLDYWRLCDWLSVDEAAHLMIGFPPGEVQAHADAGAELVPSDAVRYHTTLRAAMAALKSAVQTKRLRASVRYVQVPEQSPYGDPTYGAVIDSDEIDWDITKLAVVDIQAWLASRGIRTGFFFPGDGADPDYLDPSHPRYAPKLAAAVRAWLAVPDPKGKHPKQALMKWLRENCAQYGLSDDEGKPNEQGIEECAKVANWQPGGGAPRTPVQPIAP